MGLRVGKQPHSSPKSRLTAGHPRIQEDLKFPTSEGVHIGDDDFIVTHIQKAGYWVKWVVSNYARVDLASGVAGA